MSSILISGTLEPQTSLSFLLTRALPPSTMAHMTPQEEASDDIKAVLIPIVLTFSVLLLTMWVMGWGGEFSEDFWQFSLPRSLPERLN